MSENQNFGFGKFVPGFDFLQNLAKGASQSMPQMPNLSSWVAPTLNPEELEKRIGELKAVHFWLDQNSKALGATIQALEVQKMTLATLKGMNFNMSEVANALKLKPEPAPAREAEKSAPAPAPAQAAPADGAPPARQKKTAGKNDDPAASVADPLQWWGALTQQFQQIAASALKDAATQSGDAARNAAAASPGAAPAPPAGKRKAAAPRKRAAKTPARKP